MNGDCVCIRKVGEGGEREGKERGDIIFKLDI